MKTELRFRNIRDHVATLPNLFEMQDVLRGMEVSNWVAMAYIKRLIKLGEIREVPTLDVAAQHRVFKKTSA